MGSSESTRKVSFGLDEDEKVTVIQGVKLSGDVLQRMRDSQGPDSVNPPPSQPERRDPVPGPKPRPTASETQEELRRRFEREQALVEEQLAKLAQREREAVAAVAVLPDPGAHRDLTTALFQERAKTHEELEKTKQLAKQLDRKEAELQHMSAFYKEQLQLLEKKNLDYYKQTSEQYNQAATKAEAHIRPRHTASVCPELQAQVLQCYRENQHQTLHCSNIAKEYMQCIHAAKKNLLINHG